MNVVDLGRPLWRYHLKLSSRAVSYERKGSPAVQLQAFVRGVRSDDLFAGAMQQDIACVLDAEGFAAAFPDHPTPGRYDRLRIGSTSYSVEEWRGSPNDGAPVLYKILLRGGQQ